MIRRLLLALVMVPAVCCVVALAGILYVVCGSKPAPKIEIQQPIRRRVQPIFN